MVLAEAGIKPVNSRSHFTPTARAIPPTANFASSSVFNLPPFILADVFSGFCLEVWLYREHASIRRLVGVCEHVFISETWWCISLTSRFGSNDWHAICVNDFDISHVEALLPLDILGDKLGVSADGKYFTCLGFR